MIRLPILPKFFWAGKDRQFRFWSNGGKMRCRSLSPLFALLLALLLLGGQQAAVAHLIGHAGVAAATVVQGGDEGHEAALSLSHVCTTCLGAAALTGAAPPSSLPQLPVLASRVRGPALAVALRPAPSFPPYLARGPPAFL